MDIKISVQMSLDEFDEYRVWLAQKAQLQENERNNPTPQTWDSFWTDPICPFTARTYNCLKAIPVRSMVELSKCTVKQLKEVPNLGPVCLTEIKLELGAVGLRLAG